MFTRLIETLIGLRKINRKYDRAAAMTATESIFARLTAEFGFTFWHSCAELDRVPVEGPLIIVANHPSGGSEGIVLPHLLEEVRGDVKVLAHEFFASYKDLADRMFLIDTRAGAEKSAANGRAMIGAARWVKRGGALVIFPAGQVARYDRREGRVVERDWKEGVAQLVKLTGATVLPVHLEATTGRLHRLLGAIHPLLGLLTLPSELLKGQARPLGVRFGRPIPADEVLAAGEAGDVAENLRDRTMALGGCHSSQTVLCECSVARHPGRAG